MADSKISALPASATPLAGTEVLPIVQSGATKQVSVDNLTASRSVSVGSLVSAGSISGASLSVDNTSNGAGTIVTGASGLAANQYQTLNHSPGGGAYGYTNIQISGQDVFAAGYLLSSYAGSAVVNAPHSTGSILFKINGTQYFSLSSTGNLTQTVAGKGIDFSANTSAAGMTSKLLDDYEEGTWTPVVSSAGGTVTGANQGSSYAKVGGLVVAIGYINVSSVSLPTGALTISGLPFTSSAQYFPVTFTLFGGGFTTSENGYGGASATTFTTTNLNATVMAGGENIMFTAIYRV